MNRLMTPDEVASKLRVSKTFVMSALNSGEIPAARFGRDWKIDEDQLHEWFKTLADSQARERRRTTNA